MHLSGSICLVVTRNAGSSLLASPSRGTLGNHSEFDARGGINAIWPNMRF